jgi:hypothetical protein
MWLTVRRIQLYFEDYSELDPKKVEKNLLPTLKELEKQEILIRKNSSFTFRSAEALHPVHTTKAKKKKKPEPPPKKLGPEVVLTSSGRVSYRPAA